MVGSVVTGIATVTESASICAIYSLFVGIFVYKTLNLKKIYKALADAAIGTTVVMMVVSCASIMQFILISQQVPTKLSNALLGLGLPNWLLLIMMVLLLGVAGMVMDNVPNLYIFLPIYIPIAQSMGWSHSDGHYLPVCIGPGSVYSSCGHHPVHLLQHCQMLY